MIQIDDETEIWVEHDTESVAGGAFKGGVISISTRMSFDRVIVPVEQLDQLIGELSSLRDRINKSQ